MRKVWIMRGLPGSGKSTWVDKFLSPDYIISVDNKRYDNEGDYRKEISFEEKCRLHNQALKDFADCLHQSSTIAVDNCNIEVHMIAPYYRLAQAYDYDVEVVHVIGHPIICAKRNKHGVSEEQLWKMFKRMEQLPEHWNVSIIIPMVLLEVVKNGEEQ